MSPENMRVTIVDYGVGNVGSIANILRRYCGISDPVISCDKMDIVNSDCLIFPGVGSFDQGVKYIEQYAIWETLVRTIEDGKKPILATCVGMQLLFNQSEEGCLKGFGFINEPIQKLKPSSPTLKVPHMGWNKMDIVQDDPLFKNLHDNRFYFCHSFCAKNNQGEHVIGTAEYGEKFTAALRKNMVWATQFHPEKSHKFGIQLYKNFIEIVTHA